jgi:hypothetical protein
MGTKYEPKIYGIFPSGINITAVPFPHSMESKEHPKAIKQCFDMIKQYRQAHTIVKVTNLLPHLVTASTFCRGLLLCL